MSVLAYLDPASGSLIAATAAAGVAGMGVAAKAMWSKQTKRFRKTEPEDAAENGADISLEPDEAVSSPSEHSANAD